MPSFTYSDFPLYRVYWFHQMAQDIIVQLKDDVKAAAVSSCSRDGDSTELTWFIAF